MASNRRPETLKEQILKNRRSYIRHHFAHQLLPEESQLKQLIFEKFGSKACAECYTISSGTDEFQHFYDALAHLDCWVSQYTIDAFEQFREDKTRENTLELFKTIGFLAPPVNPEKLVIALLASDDTFQIPLFEAEPHLENKDLLPLYESVKNYIQATKAKGKVVGTSQGEQSPPQKGQKSKTPTFLGKYFYGQKDPPTSSSPTPGSESGEDAFQTPNQSPAQVDEIKQSVDRIRQKYNLAVTPPGTPTGTPKDIPINLEIPAATTENQEEAENNNKPVPQKPQLPVPQKIQLPVPAANPPPPPPQQGHPPLIVQPQQQDEEEMSAAVPYPTFNGVNPQSWLAQIERAFKANGVRDDAHDKRIGIAAYHMGSFQEWAGLHNPAITEWDNDNLGHEGFKQFFIAEFFNDDTKAEAMELASKRTQKSGENIDTYRAALEKIWQECDPADLPARQKLRIFLNGLTPAIRMSVKQTSPADLAAAVQTAKIHYRAIREEMQPSSSAEINEAMAGEIKQLKERLDSFERKPRTPFQPQRNRQPILNLQCFYCGRMGHRQAECRIKALHIKQGRPLTWAVPRRPQGNTRQGKGQPRQ